MNEAPRAATDRGALARLRAANHALERQNALLKQLVAIYDRLSGLVLQGADLDTLTQCFAELIGRSVTVLDPLLQPLAVARPAGAAEPTARRLPWPPGDLYLGRVLAALAEERRPLRIPPVPGWEVGTGCVMAPIVVGERILGYLAVIEEGGGEGEEELDLLTIQHAATVYALALMRERIAAEVASRLKDDLLEGLLLGQVRDEQSVRERARQLGYDPQQLYRVLLLVPEEPAASAGAPGEEAAPAALALRRQLLDAVVELLAGRAPGVIAAARKDEVVVLAPERGRDAGRATSAPNELARAVVRYLKHLFPAVVLTVGISGPCRDATELPRCYAQARRTVETARRFGRRGEVIAFEELGVYQLLFQVADPSELRAFADQVLGALVAYDRKHQADFVRTLAAYLRHHGSLQNAARELVVHVNTVSYRLQRIETITGLDLQNADDRLAAQLALKILEGLDRSEAPEPRD
jgi:sugar diacid utilization regulator